MRRIVIGVFTQQGIAETTRRRLEMRGFHVEYVNETLVEVSPSPDVAVLSQGDSAVSWWIKKPLLAIAEATAAHLSRFRTPRRGEVHVKVRANSLLEAHAAREILREAGAQEPVRLGELWNNWNW